MFTGEDKELMRTAEVGSDCRIVLKEFTKEPFVFMIVEVSKEELKLTNDDLRISVVLIGPDPELGE